MSMNVNLSRSRTGHFATGRLQSALGMIEAEAECVNSRGYYRVPRCDTSFIQRIKTFHS